MTDQPLVKTENAMEEVILSPVSDHAFGDDYPNYDDDVIANEDLDLTMPPTSEEDDADDADDDDDAVIDHTGRVYTPPPHIAARFYRPTQSRRKDSAASSRRNSISSAHSHSRCSSSHAYGRHSGGHQSKHIAHHLRRASILEDRKARLADRAAHAEKVRLRAALAKATPRGSVSSSEERALAAQHAREKKLAEIVASCAEDVKKARAVAETMKTKREQELVRVRAKMAERMAEADRRREEMRNKTPVKRVRGHSVTKKPADALPAIKDKTTIAYTPEAAAGKIQWWWRTVQRKQAVQEFYELGLAVDGIQETEFDRVVELLAQDKVLQRTARVLQICGLQEGDAGSVSEMVAVRSFLSAFVILGHPTQVLSSKDGTDDGQESGVQWPQPFARGDLANPQAQDLVGKARDLLIFFENVLSRLTSANSYVVPPTLQKALPDVYATFHNAFIAWKSRDSDSLVQVMIMQFVELDMIWQTVKDSTDDSSLDPYRSSIRENQVQLMVRIKRLAGEERGKRMISSAVREARKARATKKPTGDTKPRVSETSEGSGSAAAQTFLSQDPQTMTPPATPSSKPSEGEHPSKPQPIILGPGLGGLLPENRFIVHEFAINREYQIPVEEYREYRSALHKPLFDGMRVAIQTEDSDASFAYFSLMIRYFRDCLQRLVVPEAPTHKMIGEMLDPELAERQFQMGSFSYEKFFSTMSSLLAKLCAPSRDEELKLLVDNKLLYSGDLDLVDRAEALSEFVDVMLCDYVNYRLSMFAPGLIESAPAYEAKKFSDDLENGVFEPQLPAATAAWRDARSKVLAEAAKRDPESINHPKNRPTADRFYAQMLVDLFTRPQPAAPGSMPEMLHLDVKRAGRIALAAQRIVTAAAILLQCKNLLKRDVRAPWKIEASRITSVLEAGHEKTESTLQGVMAALEAGRNMPAATRSHLRALVSKVLHASCDSTEGGAEPREPVLRLLLARLRSHLFARLSAGSASEKVKAATAAGEKLAGLGLAEFAPQVREIIEEVGKTGKVDREAHTQWWEAVAGRVQKEEEREGASTSTPA